ncbi:MULTISPECIES: DUF63 family protein [Halomicrobium]|uniref:DUF63 family protein n=2 Tax=Halomicrobium mukohataei TaxID=57705 RepID=C7P3G8_HALMD|nr:MULTISPECIES: DUF63 family protein [Halomicrobium]ACV47640.1 Protein of unknown function DUF63 [Halomicrobium mukohataei DSM 12286]QCD66097.1 DUF63 family protein [Halomicrobium mukohataei]QFR20902.1 DUF63 family protein [Halomicrobium sp. ZPS1]
MQILPTSFALPPLPYLVVLLGGAGLVTALLSAAEPEIDQRAVVSLLPWMAIGGAFHAFEQLALYPPLYEPLFGTPAVYLTTLLLTGGVWLALQAVGIVRGNEDTVVRNLGLVGTAIFVVLVVVRIWQSIAQPTFSPVWPAVSLIVALAVTALVVLAISLWRTPVFVRTRYAGPVVVFAHALDGVSTAIGADVVGASEQSPLPRLIMEFAGQLPTADLLGVGWLFLLVKLVIAAAIVVSFNRYLADEPTEGALVFSLIAAVGMGPATNNLFLFLAPAF